MSPSARSRSLRLHDARGFTLIEALVTVTLLALVAGAIMLLLNSSAHGKQATSNSAQATEAAQAALDLMAQEIRSAGYGGDVDFPGDPQPAIAYLDSAEIIFAANFEPWPDSTSHGQPVAYDPDGSPRPATLDGTDWEPNQKYRTGAELIRFTLDANNDGEVDADDRSASAGRDAARTRNPNDYVLLRQTYGDSTGNVAGNNGGQSQSIALVLKPGGSVPPMFTVYLRGSSTPWNWANGPVPPDKLADIERVTLQVTAASPQPDARGRYAQTTLRTQVTSTRNLPNFLTTTYAVQGYVFNDLDMDRSMDAGEPGIADVSVRVGNSYSTTTSSTGYYLVRVPAGTYTIRHTPASGFANFTSPDTFVVSVGPGVTRSFADTARSGGYVDVHVFRDADADGYEDAGETPMAFMPVTLSPGGASATTSNAGNARLFAPTGAFTVRVNTPDSLAATGSNPQAGVMTNNGVVAMSFGLHPNSNGRITGRVFNDLNRNGSQDTGEPGVANVWIGSTLDLGVTTAAFTTTDANGDYTLDTPANSPPSTSPYYLRFLPPPGYFATTSTARGPIYLTAGQSLTGQNFGIGAFQVISLSASRVLSLASADLYENDFGTNTANARRDQDVLLGADAGGTDNISVWFNQYNANPVFNSSPLTPAGSGYTRNAPQSVLSIAADTLDSGAPKSRPDVVTGTRKAAAGNFFVWFNQNTSGNQGYIPVTYNTGQNYTTSDGGDVTAVLTLDCSGGNMPDLIVGTRSPTSGRGTVEIWQNSNATTPVFSQQEMYPGAGAVPGARMGEVAGMALADIDSDGDKDLVVVTKTGSWTGELMVFKNTGRTNGNRFQYAFGHDLDGAATCVTTTDVNGDGRPDIVLGTQTSTSSGNLQYWRNNLSGSNFDFSYDRRVDAPGIVMSVTASDLGGSNRSDISIGWRQSESTYAGGVLLYYTDTGTLPSSGTDPSNGSVVNMVPALTTANYNYGVKPTAAVAPFLPDLAAGVKVTATTGALVIFIR